MRKKLLFVMLAFLTVASLGANAQRSASKIIDTHNHSQDVHVQRAPNVPAQRTCGSMDVYDQAIQDNPDLQQIIDNDNIEYQHWLENGNFQRSATGTVTIPVVVHVIYSSNPNAVSGTRITSQIDILNADYGRTNSDAGSTPAAFQGVAANTNIQFCLATRDPQGNTTTGVNRIQNSQASHNMNQASTLKSIIQWDPYSYLNIWVVESINGGQILGYATFPTNLNSAPNLDGVVIASPFFGFGSSGAPYNRGRTGTHEVGHWLGLFHTFQGGCTGMTQNTCASQGDFCCDTPPVNAPAYGCPSTRNTCSESFPSNLNDMTMNYMDYVDDNCMNVFTQDQASRMNFYLNTSRAAIQSSQGCAGGSGGTTACATDTVNFPLPSPNPLVVYGGDTGGYVSGHNGYGDIAKAEFYSAGGTTFIDGMYLRFGVATAAGPNSSVDLHIWEDSNGSPGSIVHTETITIQNIINLNGDVGVMFTNPVTVNGSYYVGCDIDYAVAGDTVALFTNTDGDQTAATAWEQWSDNNWYAYDANGSWGLTIGHAAHPIINGLSVSVSPAAPTIPSGGSIALNTTSSLGNATYSWSPSTGLSCTNCPNPTASPTATTTYTLVATDPIANCTTSVDVTVTVTGVGIEDGLFDGQISAYPNPSNGTFMLEFEQSEIKDLEISVFNNLGQKVYVERLEDFVGSYRQGIQLSTVPAGVYHLRITDGEKGYFQKLIFE